MSKQKSLFKILVKLTIFIFFLETASRVKVFPLNAKLNFTTIITFKLFFVTHANIIIFDFSKKFNNFFSAKYKTLYYQINYFRDFG